MDETAVIIPVYNEAKTIEKVVNDARAALPGLLSMYTITIPPTARESWQRKQVR